MGVKALKAKALHFKSLFYVPFFSVKWNIDKKKMLNTKSAPGY